MPVNFPGKSEGSQIDFSSLFSQIANHQKNWWSFVNLNGLLHYENIAAHFRAAMMLYCLSHDEVLYENEIIEFLHKKTMADIFEKITTTYNLKKIYQSKDMGILIGPEEFIQLNFYTNPNKVKGVILSIKSDNEKIKAIKECIE